MRRFCRTSLVGLAAGILVLAGAGSTGFAAGGPTGLETPSNALSGPAMDIESREVATPRVVPLQAATRPRPVTGNPLWAIPLASLTVTRERPIFRPSRRPPAPVVAARPVEPVQPVPAPQEPDRPSLTLVGAVVGGSESIAVFLDLANSNAVVRLRMGELHDGWVLNSVKGREVILQRNGENALFALPAPDSIAARAAPTLYGGINGAPVPASVVPSGTSPAPAAVTPTTTPPPMPPGSFGAPVQPTRPGDFAPFVPRSTPKNGGHDGL